MSAVEIAIIGDGLVGQMAAVSMARAVGGHRVTVIGTGARDHGLGPGNEAVTLTPDWFESDTGGIVPLDWLARHARLSWSLGNAFTGWSRDGAPWFMPYGEAGAAMGGTPFHQIAARARHAGRSVRIADHSLAAVAAQVERFAYPSDDRRSPRSTLALAAHVDAAGLAAGFAHAAKTLGVTTATASTTVDASLYLDCTDAGGGKPDDWIDWRDRFPFDAVRSVTDRNDTPPPPYALYAAHPDGWRTTVPLSDIRVTTEYFTREAAPADALPFVPGRCTEAWRGNRVAIGAGACRIDPLFGAPLMLASRAIERLANLLPGTDGVERERAEFNRLTLQAAERARDTVQALYATNGRVGDAAWDDARDAARSPMLDRKLALHASRGAVPLDDGELFEAPEWLLLLDGQGIHPRRHDPLASAHSIEAIDAHLARIRSRLIDELRAMPSYAAVLRGQA